MTITVDQFVSGVERLCTSPANQIRFNSQAILNIADRNLNDTVLPDIDAVNQEFFVTKTTTPILEGVIEYAIPTRALGRKLREIKLVNPSGGKADFPMIAIEREQLYRSNATPFGFYFYGDRVCMVPTPNGDGYSIEFWWFLPPGIPIMTTSASRVVSVAGDDVTVSAVPSSITTGAVIDFIQGTPGNGYLDISKTIASIAGNVITFTTGDVPTTLAAGDYISPEGYSPICQLPRIGVYYWQTLTAMELLCSLGDFDAYDRLEKVSKRQLINMNKLLEPRIEGESQVIINDQGFGRRGRRSFSSGWYGY